MVRRLLEARRLGWVLVSLAGVLFGCGGTKPPPVGVSEPSLAASDPSDAGSPKGEPAKPGAPSRETCIAACVRGGCGAEGRCADACAGVAASARRTNVPYEDAFAEAERGFAASDPRYCVRNRKEGYAIGSGPLEREYQKTHRSVGRDGYCRSPDEHTDVTEITIERTSCFGRCPVYSVTFRANGSVDYLGTAYVERTGSRHGTIPVAWFQGLAALALDIGYFDLGESYSCQVTDMPTVYLSVTRAGKRKLVRHYGGSMTGPPRLEMFEETIDTFADSVEWSDAPR